MSGLAGELGDVAEECEDELLCGSDVVGLVALEDFMSKLKSLRLSDKLSEIFVKKV